MALVSTSEPLRKFRHAFLLEQSRSRGGQLPDLCRSRAQKESMPNHLILCLVTRISSRIFKPLSLNNTLVGNHAKQLYVNIHRLNCELETNNLNVTSAIAMTKDNLINAKRLVIGLCKLKVQFTKKK